MGSRRILAFVAATLMATAIPVAASAAPSHSSPGHRSPTAHRLVSGLSGTSGSTIGPDGFLYVTEAVTGTLTRVNPRTGVRTTYARGLPRSIPDVGIGGAMDVAFLDGRAYVIVTLVGADVGGSSVVGLYRMDGPATFTVVADIGKFSLANPPDTDFFVPTGVQFALQTFRGKFLVTDGHHNRVLSVTRHGKITELRTFGNIVPTGLETRGRTIYMAQAGPVPHLPQDGKIVAFRPGSAAATQVAAGARLLVDVELGRGHTLYGLSQGVFKPGNPEGSPAEPDTGSLVRVNHNGTFSPVVGGLDRPTSLEFIGSTAYIVTLDGEVWTVKRVAPRHAAP